MLFTTPALKRMQHARKKMLNHGGFYRISP